MYQRMGRSFLSIFFILSLLLVYSTSGVKAQSRERFEADLLLADIDRYAKMEGEAPALNDSIRERIEANPAPVIKALLPRIKQTEMDEKKLSVYVWALGLTRNAIAVDDIISLSKTNKSEIIRISCFKALATIGGQKSGEFLVASLDDTKDEMARFGLLNLLGQMQYAPALPKTIEMLKKDPKSFSWQNMLIFGKMGDKSVPFLLGKIGDPDLNVRGNSIYLLGKWLVAPESARPLQDQFWKESDLDIRGLILGSLEWISTDLKMIKDFSESVVLRAKEKELVDFATQTLKNLNGMEAAINSFEKSKKSEEGMFREQYEELYASAGKSGDYQALSVTSKPEDEAKLKKLRERILQRDSDEAFGDYKKVNEIIIFNRFMKNVK
jgi:hypothetical protein